ncbi:MAG: 4Fe-4S dicluster domain-containing protein [Moorellales bacterium]
MENSDFSGLSIVEAECCGCHACELACKQEHGLNTGPRLIRVLEASPRFLPVYCRQCPDPPCAQPCPTGAIYRHSSGVVLIAEERCTGCGACVEACPYGAMQLDLAHNRAVKCDLCLHRLGNGGPPACVRVCPTRCIRWDGIGCRIAEVLSPPLS